MKLTALLIIFQFTRVNECCSNEVTEICQIMLSVGTTDKINQGLSWRILFETSCNFRIIIFYLWYKHSYGKNKVMFIHLWMEETRKFKNILLAK